MFKIIKASTREIKKMNISNCIIFYNNISKSKK